MMPSSRVSAFCRLATLRVRRRPVGTATFADMEKRTRAWAAFVAGPEWKKLSSMAG